MQFQEFSGNGIYVIGNFEFNHDWEFRISYIIGGSWYGQLFLKSSWNLCHFWP